jgi:hypothetical protein
MHAADVAPIRRLATQTSHRSQYIKDADILPLDIIGKATP